MVKKVLGVITLILVPVVFGFAQTTELEDELKTQENEVPEGMKYGGVVSANFSQTSLTNWAAGGNNSVAVNGLLNLFLNYRQENTIWNNTADIGYGLLKQGKDGNVVKTDDHVALSSKYGIKARRSEERR